MSLYAGLKYKEKLGGIICFSGWLPPRLFESELAALPTLPGMRILMVHGTHDSKVLYDRGTSARDLLSSRGASVEFHDFEGDHTFFPPSAQWLRTFLKLGE